MSIADDDMRDRLGMAPREVPETQTNSAIAETPEQAYLCGYSDANANLVNQVMAQKTAESSRTLNREAFEKWHIATFEETPVWSAKRNLYEEFAHHMAWKGWQAALQQREISVGFDEWCASVKDCGHEVQPNSATARQRKLGWDAAMAIKPDAEMVLKKIAFTCERTGKRWQFDNMTQFIMTFLDATQPVREISEDAQDAARWRFTQEEGYFQTSGYNQYGECMGGPSVGIQKDGQSVNEAILGRGKTLKEAIDKALAKRNSIEI